MKKKDLKLIIKVAGEELRFRDEQIDLLLDAINQAISISQDRLVKELLENTKQKYLLNKLIDVRETL